MKHYIYGASGHGKVVFHSFTSCNKKVIAFIDDNANRSFCDLPVLSPSELQNVSTYSIHFAIGNNQVRYRLQTKWQQLNVIAETIIHTNSTCYPSSSIGLGCLVAAGAIVGPDSMIGSGCIINHNAVIDHDCKIGRFSHIAPSATLGGNVLIGTQCLVGANATILPSIKIGNNVVVGAGSVVTNDLPDGIIVIGCPARPINNTN